VNDPVDLAAVQAEIRERVQRKRASGAYGDDVRAALELPLPGGRALFSEDLGDPLPALRDTLAEEAVYDATSHRRFVGGPITLGRRIVIGLVRWWVAAITDRQERINQLVAQAVIDLRDAPSPQFDERLARLEREWVWDLRALFQWWADGLGGVADHDVLLQSINHLAALLSDTDAEARAHIVELFIDAGDAARSSLLAALRVARLRYPNDGSMKRLSATFQRHDLKVVADERRRFSFHVTSSEAADRFVGSLYLPEIRTRRTAAARRVVRTWIGGEIGIPLRLVRARSLRSGGD